MIVIVVGAGAFILVLMGNLAEADNRWRFGLTISLFALASFFSLGSLLLLLAPLLPCLASLPALPSTFLLTLLLTSGLALAVLLPSVRDCLSRFLPIDPTSSVHQVALFLALYLCSWVLLNLSVVGGVQGLQEEAESVPLWLLGIQAAIFVIFALAGVGLFIRRTWCATISRLGLEIFPLRSLLIAPLAVVVLLSVNITISIIWTLVDPEGADAIGQISEVLLGEFDSLGAGLLLGLLPGISEEVLFRGALQPRLGLVLTSILFASIHLQYAISPATLIIFILGLALGLLRKHFGTWTAILTHFGYNFTLFLLGMIASKILETVG